MNSDTLDRLAGYRPTRATIDAEWSVADRLAARRAILDDETPTRVHFRPVHPWRRRLIAPIAASVTVLAVVAAVAFLRSPDGPDSLAGGNRTTLSAGSLSAKSAVGAHQYLYRAVHVFRIDRTGRPLAKDQSSYQMYVAPSGDVVMLDQRCTIFVHSGKPNLANPTQRFLAGLPTDPDDLSRYLVHRLRGSSSKDEAAFVAVGDLLRDHGGLASPRLRAALVDVLSRSRFITIHQAVADQLGRPALRVDFMDQARRPGSLTSLYLDPRGFDLLEERDGSNGQPGPGPAGPSFPYSATPAPSGGTPRQLSGPAGVSVVTAEKVVDHLPKLPVSCVRDNS